MTIDFMSVSSYAGSKSSGFVRIDSDHKSTIEDWDVILVDDIVDTGKTIHTVHRLLTDRNPRSLKTCAFWIRLNVTRLILILIILVLKYLITLLSAMVLTWMKKVVICPILLR